MTAREWLAFFDSGAERKLLAGLYGGDEIDAQRARYKRLVEALKPAAREHPIRLFTAAGRTELGGNHTDHNGGKVLAAAVQLDAVAAVFPRGDASVILHSTGFPDAVIDISVLSARSEERGTTNALLRGVAAGLNARGLPVAGWEAQADSTVLPGSGLSSSAALEVLAVAIFDGLYGTGRLSSLERAQIAQRAENEYYGKPSGLMDQAASAHGGAVFIDFEDSRKPLVRRIEFDPFRAGYLLCVVNTGGNHADLTECYAAVPAEMRSVAAFFGKENLRMVTDGAFLAALADGSRLRCLRENCGDRAILRALHFFDENNRVDAMVRALDRMAAARDDGALESYLDYVNESGASSWKLLQNCAAPNAPREQGVMMGLALTRNFARAAGIKAACRVHGGGFAGTIQAYIPREQSAAYRAVMEAAFGVGCVTPLAIRNTGAAELFA